MLWKYEYEMWKHDQHNMAVFAGLKETSFKKSETKPWG
jgi:hypothetical protein